MKAGAGNRARRDNGRWYDGVTPVAVWVWVVAVAAAFWFLVMLLIHTFVS